MVLLTDGLPNHVPTPAPSGRPEDTVLVAAASLRGAGALVYTVGLGRAEDLDEKLLQAIAGTSYRYHHATDASALDEIYRRIAGEVTCGR